MEAMIDHHVERRRFFDGGAMLIERVDSIALAYGELKTGVSKSGKEWTRWVNRQWWFFSLKPRVDGSRSLTVYCRQRKSGGRGSVMQNVTSSVQMASAVALPGLLPAVISMHERLGLRFDPRIAGLNPVSAIHALAYPFLAATADWGQGRLTRNPCLGMSKALRTTNARDFATAAFAKKYVRKDLVKAVATAPLRAICFAVQAKRSVPVDWLVELMTVESVQSTRKQPHFRDERLSHLGDLLELVPMHARRRLLISCAETTLATILIDSEMLLREIRQARGDDRSWVAGQVADSRNWVQLHDALSTVQRGLRNANVPIIQNQVYQTIDGLTALDGRLLIVSAKDTADLTAWGKLMNNCIGGYRRPALSHGAYLFGLYDSGQLIANIEIDPSGGIRQLYGRFNAALDDAIDGAVRQTIVAAQKKSARECWAAASRTLVAA